jgi:cephalosporin hydroxylase/protein-L-isoaspartate O-methyltransferase
MTAVPDNELTQSEGIALDRVLDPAATQATVDAFHCLYYHQPARTWLNTYWMGVAIAKCPLDLWVYQEIVYEVRPDVIVECGTFQGGSALYLASLCDLVGNGRIYTVDINEPPDAPLHPRIEYVRGSSVSDEVINYLRKRIAADEKVLVILDSDHSKEHVLRELERYSALVTAGSYLILEDTNVNGHPAFPDHGPGPREALDEFLATHDELQVDEAREKFFLTFNPRGYLRVLRSTDPEPPRSRPVRIIEGSKSGAASSRWQPGELDSVAARILHSVRPNSRVLRVGCSSAGVTAGIRTRDCSVVAVESDESLAQRSALSGEKVIVADFTDPIWEQYLGSERFDAIVVDGALDRSTGPGTILSRLRRFLNPGGNLVASARNVAHARHRLSLLSGELPQRSTAGTWFTRRSLEELFDSAGFAVRELERAESMFDPSLAQSEHPTLPPGTAEWLALDEDARTETFVIVATPLVHGTEKALRKRVLSLLAENDDLRRVVKSVELPVEFSGPDEMQAEIQRLSAIALDLRRQLTRQTNLLDQLQKELADALGNPNAMYPGSMPGFKEWVEAQDFLASHIEESSKYTESLKATLAAREEALRESGRYVDSLLNALEIKDQHFAESARYAESLLEALRARELHDAAAAEKTGALMEELSALKSELMNTRGMASASEASRQNAETELARVKQSRLWRVGSLYWSVRRRLGLLRD